MSVHQQDSIKISFEFFPPKTEEIASTFCNTLDHLQYYKSEFASVTYGAGGGTKDKTRASVTQLQTRQFNTAVHLTCVDAARETTDKIASDYWQSGIRHIVALRGDTRQSQYRPHPQGYKNAADMVAGLKQQADFEISVAAYPEIHPDSTDRQSDLDNLKSKLDAGADRAITQFFCDIDKYAEFFELTQHIDKPIIPGILPIANIKTTAEFAQKCGTHVPKQLFKRFKNINDQQGQNDLAVEIAVEQIQALQKMGINEFHIYTLNRSHLTMAICDAIGISKTNKS